MPTSTTGDRHPVIGGIAASRSRERKWAAAGVGMVALGALLAVGTTAAATDRAPVAVAARDVPVGTVIEPGDLRLVETSGLAGADFPGTGAEKVVGRRAAVPLKEGTPIPLSALSDAAAWPGPGRAVVAASLPHSAVPEGAGMGAPVAVVLTGAATSSEGAVEAEEPVVSGRVHSVEAASAGEESLVHLEVPEEEAAAVARAAARQEMRMVLVAAGAEGGDR
ncbi:SAF domain-containing protein [Streptomonospora nanhaiensis]|uniref:SAF domain-containing protein n=1 Tax=Streptomonospora nanhaiensis TaxID=1323731 RepID=UPI00237B4F33|nr:SAF domain-containing protein [Streptomonospora nanhaiensis]